MRDEPTFCAIGSSAEVVCGTKTGSRERGILWLTCATSEYFVTILENHLLNITVPWWINVTCEAVEWDPNCPRQNHIEQHLNVTQCILFIDATVIEQNPGVERR